MKKLLMVALLSAALSGVAEAKKPVSFGVFYSSLSPYGEWIQMDVGYRWRPLHVSQGWRPYLYGQWVWSDYGWYWASANSVAKAIRQTVRVARRNVVRIICSIEWPQTRSHRMFTPTGVIWRDGSLALNFNIVMINSSRMPR